MIKSLIYTTNAVFSIFSLLILLRCTLSFLPSIRWERQPFYTLKEVTDLYLDMFKKVIPPMGVIDFSPLVAIIVLGIIQNILIRVLALFL